MGLWPTKADVILSEYDCDGVPSPAEAQEYLRSKRSRRRPWRTSNALKAYLMRRNNDAPLTGVMLVVVCSSKLKVYRLAIGANGIAAVSFRRR